MRRLARVHLAPGTVVIGDLHLDLFDEAHAAPFAAWCAGLDAPRLVILGDLFEFWVGRKQLRVPGARESGEGHAAQASLPHSSPVLRASH